MPELGNHHRTSLDTTHPTLTRRELLRTLMGLGAGVLASPWLPATALADTQSDLNDAQRRLDEANEKLDRIAAEYEELSRAHADTLAQIEDLRGQIAELETQIADLEAQIAARQDVLSERVSTAYKGGNVRFLDILMESDSFDELNSNIYYLDKITESDAELIEGIKEDKERLAAAKAQVEEREAALEEVSASEEAQLAEMRAKRDEAQQLIESLDDEVAKLMKKRDEELAAQAAAAAAARGVAMVDLSGMTGSQAAVVSACYSTPSPGLGWCAAWVSQVFNNAGYGYIGGDACDMYAAYCGSSDRSAIQPGMIVAVSTHPHTAAGRIYGHVGIYIGDGVVMDNIGNIRSISLDEWVSYYGATVPARWGWAGGMVLS